MWLSPDRDLPALEVQVVGIVAVEDGFDVVAWWTRTTDGWYVSDTLGNLGHRDAMTAAESVGPTWWQHPPSRR